MNTIDTKPEFSSFSPNLLAADPIANYWLQQVTIRLRREICWRWQQQSGGAKLVANGLPALNDPLVASLDLTRYWQAKNQFFHTDPTAKYLTDRLSIPPPQLDLPPLQGCFGWVVATLQLEEIATFVLALGLIGVFDRAAGSVIAACLNDAHATQPTLALAQLLWESPGQVLSIADLAHPLWRYGLLQPAHANQVGVDWHSPIVVPPVVANTLLFPDAKLPQILALLTAESLPLSTRANLVAVRLQTRSTDWLQLVPMKTPNGAAVRETIQGIAQVTQRPVVELQSHAALSEHPAYLKSLIAFCWLQNLDLFMPIDSLSCQSENRQHRHGYLLPLQSIPIAIFLEIRERSELNHLPQGLLLSIVEVPLLSYADRVQYWQHCLDSSLVNFEREIPECARRFRYEKDTIRSIAAALTNGSEISKNTTLLEACRAELDLDIGELAQEVIPRFTANSLVLPPKQQILFLEIDRAMRALTKVHYGWGTAKVWNESGISVLFAGPPGTGKTMAAEVLAARLDLPMYRIDLSQVVNKYIGETEKNLKRLFDLADVSDTILFFDEADALFGKRTEVKDAHDRYANLEISYLLERMERFKGLAILATNRKKDLDEAFLRRLRYILDFSLPDIPERQRIWQQVMPAQVNTSQIDFEFLARQFPLAGGHIRSIVFNACLQTANGCDRGKSNLPQLSMEQILIAVKREYDKLNRSVSLEQFGTYAKFIEGIDKP
jgi:ATPase family associated with various cellular activities (AAA)